MKIYLISQNVETGWDTYDSFVCIASSENEARNMSPMENVVWDESKSAWVYSNTKQKASDYSWCFPKDVIVEQIGTTREKTARVVLSSFNAG